jgi:hypothetical protein
MRESRGRPRIPEVAENSKIQQFQSTGVERDLA